MNRDSIDLGTVRISLLFRKYLVPTLLGMLSMCAVTATDGIFVGRGVGSDGLAAVNICVAPCMLMMGIGLMLGVWKTQARMTPGAKVDLTPENNLFLTPEEFGRRGQFYFGLSSFEGFELTDAFAGERDTVCGVDDAVEDGIRHCGVADGVVPVQFGEL